MKNTHDRVIALIKKYRVMKHDNKYLDEYIQEQLQKDYTELQKDVLQQQRAEIVRASARIDEIEKENSNIMPKSNGVDEVLRRQELELQISLMNDDDFSKFAEETLMNDHEYFDELRMFSVLKERGLDFARDMIKGKREQRLKDNKEYTSLKTKYNTLSTLVGFHGELAYEANGTIHYWDYEKVNQSVEADSFTEQ